MVTDFGYYIKGISYLFVLEKQPLFLYIASLVVLGGELAVPYTRNPLYAGLNSPSRMNSELNKTIQIGRHATDGREPRQVRKEAAISGAGCVVDRSRFCIWF